VQLPLAAAEASAVSFLSKKLLDCRSLKALETSVQQ
jgi:hypothetical protein